MQSIRKSVLIAHSAQAMFDLIDDVECYPTFLPWCGGVVVHERTDDITDATIHIHSLGLKTTFRTRNGNDRPTRIIMHFVDGPFRALAGEWRLTALDTHACKIEFALDYAFSNKIVEKMIGPMFDKIATTFVDAFVKQAHVLLQ